MDIELYYEQIRIIVILDDVHIPYKINALLNYIVIQNSTGFRETGLFRDDLLRKY